MPYIQTMTNVGISGKKKQALKQRMGEAIELIPGKSESWLMLSFHDDAHMYFRGEEEPCAICTVKLYGSASEEAYNQLTEALTDILSDELEIDPDRIYVAYEEIGTWGWNGGNL